MLNRLVKAKSKISDTFFGIRSKFAIKLTPLTQKILDVRLSASKFTRKELEAWLVYRNRFQKQKNRKLKSIRNFL